MKNQTQQLPEGVRLTNLNSQQDDRGSFTELFRQNWVSESEFIQWNIVHSNPNTLRGVHVHINHYDYLTVLSGRMFLVLKDLRQNSPTENLSVVLELTNQNPQTVLIPPGVAHGFWFPEPATILYAVSHYWDKDDELGCRFDDPELTLGWENLKPNLSERDQNSLTLRELRSKSPIIYQP